MQPRNVVILGSTGSIGCSTLDVLARHPERYRVVALTACDNLDRLARQCAETGAQLAAIPTADRADELQQRLSQAGSQARVLAGPDALAEAAVAEGADTVMAAIVGAAGLHPTLAAVRAGRRVLLANKEAMVIAGAIFEEERARSGATIIPVDSEHNALFQCLPPGVDCRASLDGVERLVLTASGGPFLEATPDDLAGVTPEEACDHPNWDMGRKISVDSATLMNKGLEVIEAHWLFGVDPGRIEVVIHPQSIVHSMVAYRDGSVIAQMGQPDMRTPIAHALAWPERIAAGVPALDLVRAGPLEFHAPDLERFPCLGLAWEALREGGDAPVVLNAANEVAVQAFLEGEIAFMDIPRLIEATLGALPRSQPDSVDDILASDRAARRQARALMQQQVAVSV